MSDETAIVKQDAPELPAERMDPFGGEKGFAAVQRMARLLTASGLVPDQYRGEANLPNAVIALEIAGRIGASPLAVMQNLYIVHGRPAWSSQFLISCVNASRRFSPLRYTMTGEPGEDGRTCVAWAQDKSGERLESPPVSIAMAKAEGWYTRNGSKWKTMPELMLRYRAATLFARLYAPELTMGIHTEDEVIDITPIVTEPAITTRNAPPADAGQPSMADKLNRIRQTVDADKAAAKETPGPATEAPKREQVPEPDWQKLPIAEVFAEVQRLLDVHKITPAEAEAWAQKAKGVPWDQIPEATFRNIATKPEAWLKQVKKASQKDALL